MSVVHTRAQAVTWPSPQFRRRIALLAYITSSSHDKFARFAVQPLFDSRRRPHHGRGPAVQPEPPAGPGHRDRSVHAACPGRTGRALERVGRTRSPAHRHRRAAPGERQLPHRDRRADRTDRPAAGCDRRAERGRAAGSGDAHGPVDAAGPGAQPGQGRRRGQRRHQGHRGGGDPLARGRLRPAPQRARVARAPPERHPRRRPAAQRGRAGDAVDLAGDGLAHVGLRLALRIRSPAGPIRTPASTSPATPAIRSSPPPTAASPSRGAPATTATSS